MTRSFSKKQLEAIDLLRSIDPRAAGIEAPEGRAVFDSIIDRGFGMVELIDSDETPSGDAYRLTDQGADAFRENAQHAVRN